MDENDKPLGFFDLPRELRNIVYRECGYYKLREGSPTLFLVEVELTKHCCPDLRYKGIRNRYKATARLISRNVFVVRFGLLKWTSSMGLPATLGQTVLPICPDAKLQHLTLSCSSNPQDMHRTVWLARSLLSQFRSIRTFKMQIQLWMTIPSQTPSGRMGMLHYWSARDSIRNIQIQQGLSFDFEVQLFFRSILMETVGHTWEQETMFYRSHLSDDNTIIYRGVPSDSKYAYRGFELFVHAVNVGDDLQAYLSS
ncbi:hypothetical protein KC345_g8174 [Hortaea werneckii]|nr:hypothetical protein KC345_g8174 [Hortaea werneckii]